MTYDSHDVSRATPLATGSTGIGNYPRPPRCNESAALNSTLSLPSVPRRPRTCGGSNGSSRTQADFKSCPA
jgi:hypothetical protein